MKDGIAIENADWEMWLPWPSKDLNPNSRIHWGRLSKSKAKYRADCLICAKAAGNPSTMLLNISFHPPDKRRRDDDNIIASFKAGRDGVAEAWGIDDREFRFTYEVSEPEKHGCVRITRRKEVLS